MHIIGVANKLRDTEPQSGGAPCWAGIKIAYSQDAESAISNGVQNWNGNEWNYGLPLGPSAFTILYSESN